MSLDIALPINGRHGITGGPSSDGVFFGVMPAPAVPSSLLSRAQTNFAIPHAEIVDANGVVTASDMTSAIGNDTQNDLEWPNASSPTQDKLRIGVLPGERLVGVYGWLTTPAVWTASGLSWDVKYPGAAAVQTATVQSGGDEPIVVGTAAAGALVFIPLNILTDNIQPVPRGTDSASYWRYVELAIAGTISGVTTTPKWGQFWPVYDRDKSKAYSDLTHLVADYDAPDHSAWPNKALYRNGDAVVFLYPEWPAIIDTKIAQPDGYVGATTYMYSSTSGLVAMPAANVYDPSDFGRAAIGTYQMRFAKPANAAKMWMLTYTLNGVAYTLLQATEPALPAGAIQVRKLQGFAIGRRYDATQTTLRDAFHVATRGRQVDANMVGTPIYGSDSLKLSSVAAGIVTNVSEQSTYQILNTRTLTGPILTGIVTQSSPALQSSEEFPRAAGDGHLLVQIKGKTTASAESEDGYMSISG